MLVAAILLAAIATAQISWAADPSPSTEADSVLKAIPDNALGFLVIKDLANADKAISKLGEVVQAPIPSQLELWKQRAGIQDGLDENGSAAIALVPENDSDNAKPEPVPIVLMPVSDYAKFIAQLQPGDAKAAITSVTIAGRPLCVVGQKGSFAVFALSENKDQLEKAIASTAGVDAAVESFEPWIRHHQVSLVATPRGTKFVLQVATAGLKQFRGMMAAMPKSGDGAQLEATLNMYDTLLADAADEIEAFGIGLRLDGQSNLSIDSHTTFLAGGSWAAAFKGVKPAAQKPFADLPSGALVLAFEGIVPKKLTKDLGSFGWNYLLQMEQFNGTDKLTDEQLKKVKEAGSTMMRGISYMSMVMAAPKTGQAIYDGMNGRMKVDDSKKFIDQYQKSLEHMTEAVKGLNNPPLKITNSDKFEIDGAKGVAVTMDLSGMLSHTDPETAKLMPLLFGTDGKVTARMVAADEHTVLFVYGDEEHAKQALADFKNPKSSLASDTDVAKVLKLLPAHAQWVGVVSINGYLDMIKSMMASIGGPARFPELPAMPPIGFAAEAGPHGLTTQLVISKETIEEISNTVHGYMQHQSPPQN